jgi:hypothetical protein
MCHTDLRTAAARHFLGLTDTDYLIEVAHAALDRGIYARGLGEIILAKSPILADIGPHFDWVLRELNIRVETRDEAIDLLAKSYMTLLAEEESPPREIAHRVYRDYRGLLYESFGPLGELVNLYYRYDYYDVGPDTIEQLDAECITLARQWCRERWLPELDPAWRTSTVVALAEGVYADRAFDRLPILADALEDAGCGHADILAHCRGDGPHARGCWVVDLLLGRE